MATRIETMTALRAHTRGGPEQLVIEQAPRPVPGADEILVAVQAAAITVAELTWAETWEADGADRTPIIPSHEFAGVVSTVGSAVEGFAEGDLVFGLVPFDHDGAAAEFVAVPAGYAAHRSPSVAPTVAAAAVLPALTAWEALVDHAGLQAGQRILIRGGTGAVGAFLTQIAHGLGADVTATVSSASAESRARRLGAGDVVVAAHGDEPSGLHGFDVAIDAVGDTVPEWMYAAVRRDGELIVLQEPPSEPLADRYGIRTAFFVVGPNAARLAELDALLASGRLQVAVSETVPLSAGAAAFLHAADPARRPGKTVYAIS